MNYYNEFDTKTAAWLRELISAKLIPAGDVDTRSIVDVSADELRGYTQCHFFAGIGGWSLALQLAGWPADKRVWSGSTPCQPFSTAGKGLAQADERHLWPVFFNLIKECRPEYVFGEQVASAIGKGWLDGISTDLGEEGYTCGSAVLGAHSLGSPHIRQRLYWVAYDSSAGLERTPGQKLQRNSGGLAGSGKADRLAHTNDTGSQGRQQCDRSSSQCATGSSVSSVRLGNPSSERHDRQHPLLRQEDGGRDTGDILQATGSCETDRVAHTESIRSGEGQQDARGSVSGGNEEQGAISVCGSSASGMVNAECSGLMGSPISNRESAEARREEEPNDNRVSSEGCAIASGMADTEHNRLSGKNGTSPIKGSDREDDWLPVGSSGQLCTDHWSNCIIIPCRDGKARRIPTEPAFFPLAHGIPARVVRLRGYGNAIVPQAAAEFIQAFQETQAATA